MELKIGLLGGGSWGTTVASLTARNCHTILWARDQDTVDDINKNHRNEKYLPGLPLHESLRASNSLEETLKDADVIIMGIPSQNCRSVLEEAKSFIRPWVPIISLTKASSKAQKCE